MKSKKFEVELHYDDRCNYVLFKRGKNFAYYLEVTEEELTGMERSLEIEMTDDNAGIRSDVLVGIGVEELKGRHTDEDQDLNRAADNSFEEYKKEEKNEF